MMNEVESDGHADNEQLYLAASEHIKLLLKDTDVGIVQTLANLEALRDEIDDAIESIKDHPDLQVSEPPAIDDDEQIRWDAMDGLEYQYKIRSEWDEETEDPLADDSMFYEEPGGFGGKPD
jgi:hypothetical protein